MPKQVFTFKRPVKNVSDLETGVVTFSATVSYDQFDLIAQATTPLRTIAYRSLKHIEPTADALVVKILQIPGQCFILDGMARASIWKKNQKLRPGKLTAVIYHVENPNADALAIYNEIYKTIDSQKAARKVQHSVAGALETAIGTSMKSFMRFGAFSGAVKMLARHSTASSADAKNPRSAALHFAPQIRELDDIAPVKEKFPSAMIAAALAVLHVDPTKMKAAIAAYNSGANRITKSGKSNAFQMIDEYLVSGVATAKNTDIYYHTRYLAALLLLAEAKPNSLFSVTAVPPLSETVFKSMINPPSTKSAGKIKQAA